MTLPQNFTSDPENVEHMDIAFNSERSIEDELEKETSGDILTIAVSYLIMFFYITFSLGQVNKVSTFMVSKYIYKTQKTGYTPQAQILNTDFPAYSDTGFSDIPVTVAVLTGPKWPFMYQCMCG